MPSVASLKLTLTAGCVCMLAAPCGVPWDAVPEQSWLLKLLRKPAPGSAYRRKIAIK